MAWAVFLVVAGIWAVFILPPLWADRRTSHLFRGPHQAGMAERVIVMYSGFIIEAATVDDLYAFASPLLEEIQQPVNVHFSREGSQRLADEVTRHIRAAIRDEK